MKKLAADAGRAAARRDFAAVRLLNRPDGGLDERIRRSLHPRPRGRLQRRRADRCRYPHHRHRESVRRLADFPQYPINPVADLNAVLGVIYAHAGYGDGPLPEEIPALWPPSEPLAGPFAINTS